jgi:glyceraldehyde-3-phosphate dehydrogenase/erythrose-4-phosphate dehydrogenase
MIILREAMREDIKSLQLLSKIAAENHPGFLNMAYDADQWREKIKLSTDSFHDKLKNKFDGLSVRVPTITVSLTDVTVLLKRNVSKEEINDAMKKAEKTYLKGILFTTEEELVSSDYIGNPASATVDLKLTNVVGGNLVKVVAWYDNEWGYANRLVEMAQFVGKK